jgi:rhodanese-related sulfurtransferase
MKRKLSKQNKSISFKIQFLLLFIILLFTFGNSILSVKANTYTNIDPDTAYSMINNSTFYPDLVILDVRTQEEYDTSHICNAILIPHTELESRISELSPYNNTEIIVYCRSGTRSQIAVDILVSYNFTKIFNMLGGIVAWISEGYEVCTNQNGQTQPTISSSFILFPISFLVSSVILIAFYKKRISKK